jgi:acetylornithine deacetylase
MTKEQLYKLTNNACSLLRDMVAIQSFSSEEGAVSDMITSWLEREGVEVNRVGNNIWALASDYDPAKPMLLINSHMDTVRPSSSYSFDPFNPPYNEQIIYGLGSNDAGASVVTMIETFLYFRKTELPFNILLAISTEEENSGPCGMRMLYSAMPPADCAIVGEPTRMEAAVAERGLLVIDATAKGVSGHAAREEGVNAIHMAHRDIGKIMSYKFSKISSLMGSVKTSVTRIEAGREHNVIPDKCSFTLDIRPNELYTNTEIFEIFRGMLESSLVARSFSNKCSMTPEGHELIQCANRCGIKQYVSPTTSDWMRIPIPAIKMGPGDSGRSHKADEFVTVEEIRAGIDGYVRFINNLNI